MPLSPYQSQQLAGPATPPSLGEIPDLGRGCHSRNTSGSTVSSLQSSPDFFDHEISTPLDRSPVLRHGPMLLPKLRTQERYLEADIAPPVSPPKVHRRTVSAAQVPVSRPPLNAYSNFNGVSEWTPVYSPSSAISGNFSLFSGDFSCGPSPVTITPSVSRKRPAHSRSVSTSSIYDPSLTSHCFNPHYRTIPNYWTPIGIPESASSSSLPLSADPLAFGGEQCDLPAELRYTQADEETMSLNKYLRASNPAIGLVHEVEITPPRSVIRSHFWWDIRQVRSWSTFTLEKLMAVPDFPRLLDVEVTVSGFPTPSLSAGQLRPATEAALGESLGALYATKINAALKIAQFGDRHMVMRVNKDRKGPTFISSYQDSASNTIDNRPRVVGVVRANKRWSWGMRHQDNNAKTRYLEGLAELQMHMRQKETRYGFLMTETELVCVRAGTEAKPYFGYLELSPVIETRIHSSESGKGQLTACMALWYLHMLAKDEPLPGECSWRVNMGPTPTMSMARQHFATEKDSWIPETQTVERRDAKRMRGWVYPGDPWNKKREGGKGWSKC